MGIVKSITHSYTYNEYLYWYIERNDVPHIEEILQKKPAIINERLTVSYVTTPLHRAAVNGNLKLVQMFIEKYSAAVDLPTDSGETALIGAVKRNHVQVVEYLIKAKANTNFVSKCGLSVSDYAILAGLYPIALLLSHYIGKE